MTSNLQASDEVKATAEYQALHAYLHGDASVSDAQEKFCGPVESTFMNTQDSSKVEGDLWQAWRAITATAAHTPFESDKRQKLADFVYGLESRPTLQKGNVVAKVWDATVWSGLPVLGAQLREVWNFSSGDASNEEQKSWLNINAFLATLTAKDTQFSLLAVWTIRTGLEQDKPAPIDVEAAAIYFLYAAQAVYQLARTNESFDGKLAQPGPLFAGKGWTGYSKERWRAWADRFSALDVEGTRGQQIIERARKNMGDILEQ